MRLRPKLVPRRSKPIDHELLGCNEIALGLNHGIVLDCCLQPFCVVAVVDTAMQKEGMFAADEQVSLLAYGPAQVIHCGRIADSAAGYFYIRISGTESFVPRGRQRVAERRIE